MYTFVSGVFLRKKKFSTLLLTEKKNYLLLFILLLPVQLHIILIDKFHLYLKLNLATIALHKLIILVESRYDTYIIVV